MVLIHSRYQEHINKILRPFKTRFGKAKCEFPRARMLEAGRKFLKNYRPRQIIQYEKYFDFTTNSERINYKIPSKGRRIRVTDLKGELLTRIPRKFDRKHKIRYLRYENSMLVLRFFRKRSNRHRIHLELVMLPVGVFWILALTTLPTSSNMSM